MTIVLRDIPADRVSEELRRRGFSPKMRVEVRVEGDMRELDAAGTELAQKIGLLDEPDLYTKADIKEPLSHAVRPDSAR